MISNLINNNFFTKVWEYKGNPNKDDEILKFIQSQLDSFKDNQADTDQSQNQNHLKNGKNGNTKGKDKE